MTRTEIAKTLLAIALLNVTALIAAVVVACWAIRIETGAREVTVLASTLLMLSTLPTAVGIRLVTQIRKARP